MKNSDLGGKNEIYDSVHTLRLLGALGAVWDLRSFMLKIWWKVMKNSDLGAKMKSAPGRFILK